MRNCLAVLIIVLCVPAAGRAQTPPEHQHHMPDAAPAWSFMQDGVLFGMYNHQGGARGGDEFKLPNWWMGMLSRAAGRSTFTINVMVSADPATVGTRGYGEIFQVGEAVDGRPLIDRQHPHDFLMQLAAVWHRRVSGSTGFTLAGGPAGEPALGPVAFMHRISAAENPLAPLGHHTFDSTHIAFGVITAGLDRGAWTLEGSLFNGREPDENRWDLDLGRLDSVSGRVWYKPSPQWEFQVSSGRLVDPEELDPGNVVRTTTSASWMRRAQSDDFSAATFGYGINATSHGRRSAGFVEATRRRSPLSIYGRVEVVQVETEVLRTGLIPEHDAGNDAAVWAFTAGAVRDVLKWRGVEGGFGAQLTAYATPAPLGPTHGDDPVSFQIFFRLRPPANAMGRMWNMRMSQPMAGHSGMR